MSCTESTERSTASRTTFSPCSRLRQKASSDAATPFPSIECPTVPLALEAVLDSDATTLAALSMARAELERGVLSPLLHEPWMCSNWAIVKLRRRSLGPAATAVVVDLQRAHEEALARDLALCRVWERRMATRRRGGATSRRTTLPLPATPQ